MEAMFKEKHYEVVAAIFRRARERLEKASETTAYQALDDLESDFVGTFMQDDARRYGVLFDSTSFLRESGCLHDHASDCGVPGCDLHDLAGVAEAEREFDGA